MARVMWFAAVLAFGCSKDNKEAPPSASTAAPATPTKPGASPLANAAAKLTDPCPLLAMDKVKQLIPDGSPPKSEQYPLRCSVYGKDAALEIAFDSGPPPDPKDGEPVTGIAQGGILQRPNSKFPGNVYVTISLGSDDNGNNRNLHAEVNTAAGDHKDDALELARYVIAHLH